MCREEFFLCYLFDELASHLFLVLWFRGHFFILLFMSSWDLLLDLCSLVHFCTHSSSSHPFFKSLFQLCFLVSSDVLLSFCFCLVIHFRLCLTWLMFFPSLLFCFRRCTCLSPASPYMYTCSLGRYHIQLFCLVRTRLSL